MNMLSSTTASSGSSPTNVVSQGAVFQSAPLKLVTAIETPATSSISSQLSNLAPTSQPMLSTSQVFLHNPSAGYPPDSSLTMYITPRAPGHNRASSSQQPTLSVPTDDSRPYKCSFCDKSYTKQFFLAQHLPTHTGAKPYKCEVCLKTFRSSTHLKEHAKTHILQGNWIHTVADPSPPPKKKRKAAKKGKAVEPPLQFKQQEPAILYKGESFPTSVSQVVGYNSQIICNCTCHCAKCSAPPSIFYGPSMVPPATRNATDPLPSLNLPSSGCGTCRRPWTGATTLPSISHLPKTAVNLQRWGDTDQNVLYQHQQQQQQQSQQVSQQQSSPHVYQQNYAAASATTTSMTDRPFKCDLCNKTYTKQFFLMQHVRSHTGERPYQCVMCRKSFRSSTHLRTHTLSHTGERPFKCSLCSSTLPDALTSFRAKRQLVSHMMTRHDFSDGDANEFIKQMQKSERKSMRQDQQRIQGTFGSALHGGSQGGGVTTQVPPYTNASVTTAVVGTLTETVTTTMVEGTSPVVQPTSANSAPPTVGEADSGTFQMPLFTQTEPPATTASSEPSGGANGEVTFTQMETKVKNEDV